MKLYKNLPCDNYTEINNQIKEYIDSTDIVTTATEFWNVLPTIEFIRAVPLFRAWTESRGFKLHSLALTVGRGPDCCALHIDTPPAVFKLSWPIANTQHTFNRWFKPIVDAPEFRINSYGGRFFPDLTQFEELDCKEVITPCIINAGIPHDVWSDPNAQWPRLGLQCMLFNEPKEL
jgi:hypothetical protein